MISTHYKVFIGIIFCNSLQAGIDLHGQTFDSYDFTEAYTGSALVRANFRGCTFTGNCNFDGLDLTGANFSGATFTAQGTDGGAGAVGTAVTIDFSNTNLTGARFTSATFIAQGGTGGTGGFQWRGGNGTIEFDGADLTGVHFNAAIFRVQGGERGPAGQGQRGSGGTATIDFKNTVLTRSDFNKATLETLKIGDEQRGQGSINFQSENGNTTDITYANFSEVDFIIKSSGEINFTDANISHSNFSKAVFALNGGTIVYTRCNFTDANFGRTVFTFENVSAGHFTAANFTRTNFNHAIFSTPTGDDIYMGNGNTGAGEPIVNFSYTNFSGATGLENLQVNFAEDNDKRVSLDNTIYINTDIPAQIEPGPHDFGPVDNPNQEGYSGTPIDENTPNLAAVLSQHVPNIDLSDLDLTDFDFTGVSLDGANFTGSILTGANFTNATLRNVIGFTQTDYVGTNIDAYTSVAGIAEHNYLAQRNEHFIPFVS